jgi:hypothetical protein
MFLRTENPEDSNARGFFRHETASVISANLPLLYRYEIKAINIKKLPKSYS